jgi:hypothetical protein
MPSLKPGDASRYELSGRMNHLITADFWRRYRGLPPQVRELADKSFALMKNDPHHPSLRLKKSAHSGRCAWDCVIVRWPAIVRRVSSGSGSARMMNIIIF